jgi:ABC-2 type transport system ATP-binding protein
VNAEKKYILRVTDPAEVESILARLREANLKIEDMQLHQADLEDVFIQIMDGGK